MKARTGALLATILATVLLSGTGVAQAKDPGTFLKESTTQCR